MLQQAIESLQQAITTLQATLDALIALLPVDAVLSDWQLVEAGEWSLCGPDGTQTRTEQWARTVLEPAKNGGSDGGPLTDTRIATQACVYDPPPPPPPLDTERNAYFEYLKARPDVHLSLGKPVALGLRSQAEIDAVPTGSDAPTKWPVVYDEANDAMLQRTLGGRGVNAVQKQPRIALGGNPMLVTWDFMIGAGAKYQGDGYLKQYKAYRLDHGTNTALWLSFKLKFPLGATATAVAELLTTGIPMFLAPGTTNAAGRFWFAWLSSFG